MSENENQLHVVVGAGAIGTAVAELLAGDGHRVRVVTRSGSGPEHPLVERVAADAADAERLTELTRGAAALYNCANPQYHRWPVDWPPLASSLLTTAERTGAVLATCSNLYVYGPVDGPMTEQTPLRSLELPSQRKGAIRARMWLDALAAHEAGRARVTEVRASSYSGVTSQGLLDRVVPNVVAGKAVRVVGSADQPHSLTYTRDEARMLVVAAADERAWGRAWHCPTPPARTQRQAIEDIAAAAGAAPAKVGSWPRWMLRAVGLGSPTIRELGEVMHQFERPWVIDSSAAERTFGIAPTPWPDVVAETVAHHRRALAA